MVSESCWLRNLLLELHCRIQKATLIYCDNVSAIYLSRNPIQHQRTKHRDGYSLCSRKGCSWGILSLTRPVTLSDCIYFYKGSSLGSILRIFKTVSMYDNLPLRQQGYVRIYVNIFLYLIFLL